MLEAKGVIGSSIDQSFCGITYEEGVEIQEDTNQFKHLCCADMGGTNTATDCSLTTNPGGPAQSAV